MSISYKTENGFTTITIAENFDGEVSYKNGKITIIRCGAGGAGSFSCGPAGGGGAVGSNGREGRGIEIREESGAAGSGGHKWNPRQYKRRNEMTQKQLSEKIGVHERTIRKWSPRKRQQWQSLATKGRDLAWFDLLTQLCFEVDAFNTWDNEQELNLTMRCQCVFLSGAINMTCHDADDLAAAIEKVKQLDGDKQ